MARLKTDLGIDDADGFYARLIELHDGLSLEQSRKINAKAILMMANHIGDAEVLEEVLDYLESALPNKQK
jgi:Protein of unknown function (DUF2783)